MSKFKCTITDCPNFGQEVEIKRVTWTFKDGKLRHDIRCPRCNAIMEYKEEKFEPLPENIIARYGSWTKEQKAEYRKKHNINDAN